jgi:hypothetical protein
VLRYTIRNNIKTCTQMAAETTAAETTCLRCELATHPDCPPDIMNLIWHDSSCTSPTNYCKYKDCQGRRGKHTTGCWKIPGTCCRCFHADGTHAPHCVPLGTCRRCKLDDNKHADDCVKSIHPVCSMCMELLWGVRCERCGATNKGPHVHAAYMKSIRAASAIRKRKHRQSEEIALKWLQDWADTAGG